MGDLIRAVLIVIGTLAAYSVSNELWMACHEGQRMSESVAGIATWLLGYVFVVLAASECQAQLRRIAVGEVQSDNDQQDVRAGSRQPGHAAGQGDDHAD